MDFYSISKRRQKSQLIKWAYQNLSASSLKFFRHQVDQRLGKNNFELGCGTGKLLFKLAKQNPDKKFWGIDSSVLQIKTARQKSLTNLNFVVSKAEKYRFPAKPDLVFGQGVLHHLNWQKMLRRLIKQKISFIFWEPMDAGWMRIFRRLTPGLRDPHEQPFKLGQIEKLCAAYQLRARWFTPQFKFLAWTTVIYSQ